MVYDFINIHGCSKRCSNSRNICCRTNYVVVLLCGYYQSFLFRSGSWEDYRQVSLENAASSPESAALPEARIYYDNFAIKGYCNYIAGDMAMVPVVLNDNQLVTKEGYNSTKIQLQFRGPSVMEMGAC